MLGSRPQGNDGILYSTRAVLLYFKRGVKILSFLSAGKRWHPV